MIGLNTLESLYQQALTEGIAVENFPMPQVTSVAVMVDNRYFIGIDRSRMETSIEEAECLAHEMGHCETHSLYAMGEKERRKSEKRAEEWAILRLVPQKRFLAACKNGCREVWEFAEELNITCPFAAKVMSYYLGQNKISPIYNTTL